MGKQIKWGLAAMMIVVLGWMIVGCAAKEGSPVDKDNASTAANEAATAEENGNEKDAKEVENEPAASSETEVTLRAWETEKGTVHIPDKPQRIVTDYYAGELIAAGLNVVGVAPLNFDNPFLQEGLQHAEDAGQPLNVEKILTLQPDLIVIMYDQEYESLSQIAPTIHIPFGTASSFQETVALFGRLSGDADTAQMLLDTFEEKARVAKEQLQAIVEEGATFGVYELVNDDGSFWIFGDNAGRGGQVLYNALELPSPHPDSQGEQTLQLQTEVLPEYAADYMFLTVYDPENKGEALRNLQESKIWQNLPAVQNNRLFINSFDEWYPNDPLAILAQLDKVIEMISEREAEHTTRP